MEGFLRIKKFVLKPLLKILGTKISIKINIKSTKRVRNMILITRREQQHSRKTILRSMPNLLDE